jgi:hypothetical protein
MSSSSNVSPGFKFQAQPSVWVSVHPASCVSVCLSACLSPYIRFGATLFFHARIISSKLFASHQVLFTAPSYTTCQRIGGGAVTTRSGKLIRLKFRVFWDVAPCSHVDSDRRFRGAYCLHLQGNELSRARKDDRPDRLYRSLSALEVTNGERVTIG